MPARNPARSTRPAAWDARTDSEGKLMTPAIPVIDVAAAEAGDRAELEAVRTATEEFGAIQVVNHGVPQDLVADLNARAGRLLGLPRAEKAASLGLATRMLGLYAAAQGLPAGSFGLGTLPHLRLTVNDYPTWTYPETASEEDKLLLLEHADDSAVTVLAQQGDYEGLQV